MTAGAAMSMRLALARLAVQHQLAPKKPCIVPLIDPIDYPVTVQGYASTAGINLDRTRFRSHAFTVPPWLRELPRLLTSTILRRSPVKLNRSIMMRTATCVFATTSIIRLPNAAARFRSAPILMVTSFARPIAEASMRLLPTSS
jgi:hypothetical protein